MASQARTLIPGSAIQAPLAWGIEPVSHEQRRLRGIHFAVLWGGANRPLLRISRHIPATTTASTAAPFAPTVPVFAPSPRQHESRWSAFAAFLVSRGVIAAAPADLFTNELLG